MCLWVPLTRVIPLFIEPVGFRKVLSSLSEIAEFNAAEQGIQGQMQGVESNVGRITRFIRLYVVSPDTVCASRFDCIRCVADNIGRFRLSMAYFASV